MLIYNHYPLCRSHSVSAWVKQQSWPKFHSLYIIYYIPDNELIPHYFELWIIESKAFPNIIHREEREDILFPLYNFQFSFIFITTFFLWYFLKRWNASQETWKSLNNTEDVFGQLVCTHGQKVIWKLALNTDPEKTWVLIAET